MKRFTAFCVVLAFVGVVPAAFSQEFTTAQVLAKLDEKARVFTSLQASVKRQDVNFGAKQPEESGKLTIEVSNGSPRIFFEITEPNAARKSALIEKDKGTVYFPNTNSYMERPVDQKSEQLQLLLLGFGTRSALIEKGYKAEVKRREAIGGVQAVVFELTSISKSTEEYPTITLWLDPQSWTPVQTRLGKGTKSWFDFKYSSTQLNRAVPKNVFDLKMAKGAKKQ